VVWVENCDLLSGGNTRELDIDKQFPMSRKVNTKDNRHCCQVQLALFYELPGSILGLS